MPNKANLVLPLAFGALLLVGAGCSGKSDLAASINASNANASEEAQPTAEKKPRQLEVELGATGSAGLSGKAVLVEENEKTKVMIKLSDDASTGARPAHIHAGECPTPGKVLHPLAGVVNGRSTTLLDVRFDDILAAGSTAINVHKSSSELGAYLSCGNLLTSKVMDKQAGVEAMMQAETETKVEGGKTDAEAKVNVNVNANLVPDVNAGVVMAAKVVKITAKQFSFDPAEVRVKLGEKVRLEVTSVDVEHGIAVPAFNLDATLKPGTTTKLEFTADKTGGFPFFCNVFCGSGHGGMRGTLIVE